MSRPLWTRPDLPALLASDLNVAAEPRWRRELAPELSYNRHAGPPRSDARTAAVAIVLCWDGCQWALPLTVRGAALSRHGGQISLPGGLIDPDESPCEAAARELEEELGERPMLEWLGELTPLFVFASNTAVTPCVAAVNCWPAWRPHPAEVDEVLKLELRELVQQELAPPLEIERGPQRFSAPHFIVEGRSAWGATAVMLGELRGRLRRIAPSSEVEEMQERNEK